METKSCYENSRLTALDGTTYAIASPWCKRRRPAHLGEINFRWICIECGEQIDRDRKGQFCSDLCKRTHAVSKRSECPER